MERKTLERLHQIQDFSKSRHVSEDSWKMRHSHTHRKKKKKKKTNMEEIKGKPPVSSADAVSTLFSVTFAGAF